MSMQDEEEHMKHEAERKKLTAGGNVPPAVDNAHVEEGATLFSQGDINSNQETDNENDQESSEESNEGDAEEGSEEGDAEEGSEEGDAEEGSEEGDAEDNETVAQDD